MIPSVTEVDYKLKREEYLKFLASPQWQKLREQTLKRDGYRCRVCNKGKKAVLQVHHRTYERFGGNEELDDLTTLCEGCHELFHSKKPKKKASKFRTGSKAQVDSDVLELFIKHHGHELTRGIVSSELGYSPAAVGNSCGRLVSNFKIVKIRKHVWKYNKPVASSQDAWKQKIYNNSMIRS